MNDESTQPRGAANAAESLSAAGLAIDKQSFAEGLLCLRMEGRLDYNSSPAARAFLTQHFRDHQPRRLRLDMARLDFMDSEGLSVLVTMLKLCSESASQLTLFRPNKSIGNIVRQTRLDRVIQIEE